MRRVFFGVLLGLLLICAVASSPEHLQVTPLSGTQLYVSPSLVRARFPRYVTIEVVVVDVADLIAFDISLGYNSTVLEVDSVTVPPPFNFPPILPVIIEGQGYVQVAVSLLDPELAFSGTGVLFQVRFHTASKGSSSLHLYNDDLAGYPSGAIPHETLDGYVQVFSTIAVPDDYPTIQGAINHASLWDEIFVSSGTYYESPQVNKTLSLIGEFGTTIIDGNLTGDVVTITADDASLQGFTIVNAGGTDVFDAGVLVANASRVRLTYNAFRTNCLSINLEFSQNTTLQYNTVVGQFWWDFGIRLYWSNSCLVSDNDVSGGWAALLQRCHNNTLVNNTFFAKGAYGIRLAWSQGNLITRNTILNATTASPHVTGTGLWLSYSSTNNQICRNSFLNNTIQAHGHNLTNTWDTGYAGNYWSDYNGTDLDGDGVGDFPYVIDMNNTDHYPLMNPYWSSGDVNYDLKVDIYDVVIFSGAYLATPSDPNWNPHCDVANPNGVIDIFDIVMMCGYYGEEYGP